MFDECSDCIYFKDETCHRKEGVIPPNICMHYVDRKKAKNTLKAMDELIAIMVKHER